LLVCFGLYYGAEQPFSIVLAVAVPMLVLYACAPLWARSSMAAFDRDAVQLLASGQSGALVDRYERAIGMRLFAPAAVCAERQAMALAEAGQTRAARAAFRESLDEYGDAPPLRVLLGYAHASFALGDDAEAIPMYRKLLQSAVVLPGVERHLAYALVRSGEDPREALSLLDRAPREPDDAHRRGELSLLRAVAHTRLGEHDRAASYEAEAGGAVSDATETLRTLLRSAREGSSLPRA
jgi:tetratricopeptide (TPR) repeat protein